MELKTYLRILLKKWWIVLATFLITFITTAALTFMQKPVYQTMATFVVSPTSNSEDSRSFASGLNILSTQSEIATTYTEVAKSREIKNLAADELDIPPEIRFNFLVTSRLRAGTNVLEITVQGNNPQLVQVFANAVGRQTVIYVQQLYETFELRSLDQATTPNSPIKPNKTVNLALGAVLGLVLGIGLAFLAEYLQTPAGGGASFDSRGLRAEGIATPVATLTPTSMAIPISARPQRLAWFIPMIGVTGLLIITTLAVAFWQARRRTTS